MNSLLDIFCDVGNLVGKLNNYLMGKSFVDREYCRQRQKQRMIERERDRQTDRQTDRQRKRAHRQIR